MRSHMTLFLQRGATATSGLLALLAIMLGACAVADSPESDIATVRTRAAFDLNCPETEVRGRWLDEKTLGVTACGQRATYVKLCKGQGIYEECQWVLNNNSRPERAE